MRALKIENCSTKSLKKETDQVRKFERIYKENVSYVWNCLRRLGVETRDLEDKTHDVFVTFYRRMDDYDETKPARPWLCGIAARIALDHNRLAYKKREFLINEFEATDEKNNPEKTLENTDALRLLEFALDKLDTDRRIVFVLHDIEEYSIPEIVDMLNVPINTLYSRLRSSRELITDSVKRLLSKRCGK